MTDRVAKAALAAAILLSLAAAAAPANELDRLLAEVKPPARFKDHKPNFRVTRRPHTYHWWDWYNPDKSKRWVMREYKITLEVVMDGELPVALAPNLLFAPYPGCDTRGWVNEDYTPEFQRFGIGIPSGGGGSPTSHKVAAAGETLKIVIMEGVWPEAGIPAEHGKYHPHIKPTSDVGAVTTLTFSVDPVLGYVVDRHTKWRRKTIPADARTGEPVRTIGSGGFWPLGITLIWPDQITHRYSAAVPDKTDRGAGGAKYVVWSNNCESLYRKYHPVIRPDGFAAYLNDRFGWGAALLPDTETPLPWAQCPIWGEFHTCAPLGKVQQKDGWFFGEIRQRMVGLPPEVCEHIVGSAKVINGHGNVVLVRVAGENFDDQPLPASTIERGFQPGEGKISTERAHSGKKSYEVKGVTAEEFAKQKFWPRDRGHTRFLPSKPYRMDCWVYVEGADTEAFVIPTPGLGFEPKDLLGAAAVGKGRTRSVKAGEGWQHVSLDFVGQKHGSPINVRFVVIGPGKAYFDDFRMTRVP